MRADTAFAPSATKVTIVEGAPLPRTVTRPVILYTAGKAIKFGTTTLAPETMICRRGGSKRNCEFAFVEIGVKRY